MFFLNKAFRSFILAVSFIQFVMLNNAEASPPNKTSILAGYGQTPLRFETVENETNQQVRYISRGSGYAMYFMPTGIVMALDLGSESTNDFHRVPKLRKMSRHNFGLVQIKFEGSSQNPTLSAEQMLPEKINYFLGNDISQWRTNQAAYGKVHYQNLYPGIDLVFYGNQSRLEYDFVLAPHADANLIALDLEGADWIKIETDGELTFSVHGRKTRFEQPILYQIVNGNRRNIVGSYSLQRNRVTFQIGAYDHSLPLIIDPVLSYSTFLGGSGLEYGNYLTVDSDGNAYVCGMTLSSSLQNLITPGAFQTNYLGGTEIGDGFVAKVNSTGTNLVYFTYLGGSPYLQEGTVAYGIKVDANGNAYIVGGTYSLSFPTTNALFPSNPSTATGDGELPESGFVCELNTNGSRLIFSTYLGSSFETVASAVDLDSQNNIYVGGITSLSGFPVTNAIQSQWHDETGWPNPDGDDYSEYDGFVTKFNSNGVSLAYSTYFGGHNEDELNAVAVDSQGNLYAAGYTYSTDLYVTNALQSTNAGGAHDGFVFKLGPAGTNVIFSTYLGGNGDDIVYGIGLDTNGNAYITGVTFSPNFPITNALQAEINGTGNASISDAFLTKLTPSGQMVYSTYLGGSGSDFGFRVAVQPDGEAVVVGQTGSTDFAPYANYGSANSGNLDGFVARLNSAGNVLENFAYLGGGGADFVSGVALDMNDNAYVVGYTASSNFPITGTNVVQSNYGGGAYDAFVAKLYFEPNQLGTTVYTSWGNSNGVFSLEGTASLATSNNWPNIDQLASESDNGVASLQNSRLQRGVSYDPTFTSFIIPLNQQTGFHLDDLGNNSENFGGSFPWFTRLQNDIRTHVSLIASTNILGASTNYYGYVTNFINPIAAFGATAGQNTLYVNQPYQFGVYCGAQYESSNADGTVFQSPLRILVYNLTNFVAGQTNLVAPFATNYITIPRRTIATDSTNWYQFSTNGFSVTITTNGLRTTVQLVVESSGAWGVVPQFTNAQNGTYLITEQCTTNMGYGYMLEGVGVVPLGTNLYPMVTNSSAAVGWDRLYTLDFQTRPPWRSIFVDQPQFNGVPMPSFYQGTSPSELTNLDAVLTNSIPLVGSQYTTLDNSPELRRSPLLDQLVASLNNDPIALANYVQNQIQLSDALAYDENNGSASEPVVNAGGVNRNALGVYLEGQGSPMEQCALLVYLLRQAGYPAAYVFPTNNNVLMLDTRLSSLLRMQLHGAVNQYGQLYTTNTLIAVNYPWVVTTISNKTVQIFPWLKDTQVTEGLDLYDYMPTNYNSGFRWLQRYLYGDTNIMGLSSESDAPDVLFPRFIENQLLTNAPGISIDDIGVNAFDRQHYYTSWQDFPTPTMVNNPNQIVCVDSLASSAITNVSSALTNVFDTVTLAIWSQQNTNTQMVVGPLRMADLHNREMFISTNGTNGLMLWLAPYIAGNTNISAFNSSDPALTNTQVAVLNVSSNDVGFEISMTHNRHQAINFTPAQNQYLGISEELQFTTPPRPFNLQDITAICFNVGRVTPAMINIHASAFQQTAYQWSLNTNSIPPVSAYQALAAYMMGMDYYSHVSAFMPICEQLHKTQVISWNAEGLSRLTSVQLGAQTFERPSMDMFYSEMAHAGNGSTDPDSGNDPLAATDDFTSIMDGEIAAQEHGILNGYYQTGESISSIVLLRLAQQRATNGQTGIIELNNNNYLAIGNTNANGYGPTALKNYDPTIWAAVTNAFSGWDAQYVRAYITPGPVSVQSANYRGMGLVVVGKSESASLISVNMNGALGPESLYFGSAPASISSSYASSSDSDFHANDTTLEAGTGFGASSSGGDLYYGGSAYGGDDFDYYWTTPTWAGGTEIWPYVMPADYYQIVAAATPPSQINLSVQINDLYDFPQSTSVATSLTHELDSGNTGEPAWKNMLNYVYDPVNVINGEYYHTDTDLTLAGPQPLNLRRNYSSQNQSDRNGFGYGWDINVVPYISIATNVSGSTSNVILTAVELDGSVIAYRQQTNNANLFLPIPADNLQLDNDGGGKIGSIYNPFNAKIVHSFIGTNELYTLTGSDGQVRIYMVNAFPVSTPTNVIERSRPYLTHWADTQGNYWNFLYDTNASDPGYGNVVRVNASNGSYLGIDYNAGGYVSDAYSSGGLAVNYQYDDFGDLIGVTRPDGTLESYQYQHIQYTNNGTTYIDSTHLLIEEIKPDGRELANVYDGQRRVVNQLATVGQDLKLYTNATFTYVNNFALTNFYTNPITGYTTVKDVNGNSCRYDYTNGLVTTNTDQLGQKIIQNWYADSATSPGYPRSLFQVRDKRGLWRQFQYDANGNLTNTFIWGDLTGAGTTSYASNTFTYNNNNLPTQITDPVGNSIDVTYASQFSYLPAYVEFLANGSAVYSNQFTYGNSTNFVTNGSLTLTNFACGLLFQEVQAANSTDASTNQWTYDGRGYCTQTIQYTGTGDANVTNTVICDDLGQVVSTINSAGQQVNYAYDQMMRPISHEVFAAGANLPMFSEFFYYTDNGELNWYQGPHANPEDYRWYDYDGAGRPSTEIDWRSEANTNGTGVEAPSGYNVYAQKFYQYDKFGNLLLSVDPRGEMTTNVWDAIGQLVQQKHLDTNGVTLLGSEGFSHEPGGLVSAYTNALGGVTTVAYTTNGLPKYQINPDGSTNGWRYYLNGRIFQVIQVNGAYWQFSYDDFNRIVAKVFYSATGVPQATNSVQLDRRGNVIETVDAANNVFMATYDGLNRLKTFTGPPSAGNTAQQSFTNYYDSAGVAFTNVNALGESSVAFYDPIGRVTEQRIYSSAGAIVRDTSANYFPDFSGVTITNGTGSTAVVGTYYYNNDGQNVLSIGHSGDGSADFSQQTYDLSGNLIAQSVNSSAGGIITNWASKLFSYDGLNRIISKIDRDGALTTYHYDQMGNLTNSVLPNALQINANYSTAGQLIKSWYAGSSVYSCTNTYSYFPSGSLYAGLLGTNIDGRGARNVYSYDIWLRPTNLLCSGALPEENMATFLQYDVRGYVTNILEQFTNNSIGPVTSIGRSFDAYGQLSAEAIGAGAFNYGNVLAWDGAGRRIGLQIGSSEYNFGWQADGALNAASVGAGSAAYYYGTSGLLNGRILGNRSTQVTSRDGEGRPLTIQTAVISGGSYLGVINENTSWRGDGLLTADTIMRGDFTDSRSYSYANSSQRLVQEQLNLNATTTWTNSMVYDGGVTGGLGVLTHLGLAGSTSNAWNGAEDGLNRINGETNNILQFAAYGHANGPASFNAWLDGLPMPIVNVGTQAIQWRATMELNSGSHQLVVSALHPSGQYTAWATNTFNNTNSFQRVTNFYDFAGNITNRIWISASGTTDQVQSLSWDAHGRLHQIINRDASNSGYNWVAIYDGLGRRLQTSVVLVTNGVALSNLPPSLVSSYYDPVASYLELGVAYGSNTEWKLYGPDLQGGYGGLNGCGGLDGVLTSLGNFNPTLSDIAGNIYGYYDSNAGQIIYNSSRPTGYGAVPGYRPVALGAGANIEQASSWRGRWSDVSGYYGIGARTYDPVGGRWLSFDLLWNDMDPNGYTFCGGDPINYFDPDGRLGKQVLQDQYNGGIAGKELRDLADFANQIGKSGSSAYLSFNLYNGSSLLNFAANAITPASYVNGYQSLQNRAENVMVREYLNGSGNTGMLLQGTSSVVGDALGYNKVYEATFNVDRQTLTSLSTAERWSRGLMGGSQLVLTGTGLGSTLNSSASLLNGEITGGSTLNTYGDALRSSLGPGRLSHPEEWAAKLSKVESMGVEVVPRPGTLAYEPAIGKPGRLLIDPDASIGALRHEFQHAMDDAALGHPGFRIMADPEQFWRLEFRGYMEEINTARSVRDFEAGRAILEEMIQRRMDILGE